MRRNSVLIGAIAEQQKKYKNYLQKVAKLGKLGQELSTGQKMERVKKSWELVVKIGEN
ncbi:MAG: hypothetical protein F6K50_53075 [Moorea sp. SIO3I7]|nr:hypothetical protein [Moorena sp. SIO3I7]